MVDPTLYIVEATDEKVVFERHLDAVEPFCSSSLLFQALRDTLTAALPPSTKEFWLIKFSSRVMCSSMPLLHNPVTYKVLVDPLQAVRDPVKELQISRRLELFYYPSKSYFYRKRIPTNDSKSPS